MTNVQDEVTNFIDQDVSIRRGLSRGLINSRALAKYIHENLGLTCSIDGVISAIRRYRIDDSAKEDIKKRYQLIASAKVSSRSKMASVLLKKSADARSGILGLYDRIGFSKGEVLRILEVSGYIKVILDESNLGKIGMHFRHDDVISQMKDLGEICITYPVRAAGIPGIFAAISSELSLSGISLVDGVICGEEHIFIVEKDDLMKSLETMHRIIKWGEKVRA